MGTYYAVWQCTKCKAQVSTRVSGYSHGWHSDNTLGKNQLVKGPCPCGGNHDWQKLAGHWNWDED